MIMEKTFGTQLREYAARISKERFEMRREIQKGGFRNASNLP